jgi:hypothetical protein
MSFHRNIKTLLTLALVSCMLPYARGQITDTTIFDWRRGLFPKQKDGELYQIKATGFYRFFATYQQQAMPYTLVDNVDPALRTLTKRRTLTLYDDTQLPNFLVNVSGRPNKKVSWGFDIFMFQFLEQSYGPTYRGLNAGPLPRPPVWDPRSGITVTGRLGAGMLLNVGLNLYGSYITNVGTFNVRMGGIHFYSISDLTLGSFRGYNRFMLYERNPWDPIGRQVGVRYNQMYEYGSVYQDLRWGERAVQGIILDGINLPGGWSFSGMYGKTELAGGFLTIPNVNFGGKIKKTYNNTDFVALNTMNNTTWLDSLNERPVGFNLFTGEWKGRLGGFDIHAEAGVGKYNSPREFPWGEAITLKVLASERLIKFPVEVHYYRISPYVVNNNAIFWNTTIIEDRIVNNPNDAGVQSANVLIPFASSMVAIGQMTNNRTGVNLNTEVKIGEVKVSLGYGVSSEIEAQRNLNNTITFSHFVNQLTRARFWRFNFPTDVGPYGRYDKVYRDAYQKVIVTDDSLGLSVSTRKFTQFEVHGKYRTKIGYRNFYAFFLGRYNTAQPELTVLPMFTDKAYVRQYNSELEMYYQIRKPLFFNAYLGYERVLGGYNTTVDEITQRPLNQTGWGVGVGMDIALGRNAGLYLRHRWYFFEDTSFQRDKFQGQETLVELKVFF